MISSNRFSSLKTCLTCNVICCIISCMSSTFSLIYHELLQLLLNIFFKVSESVSSLTFVKPFSRQKCNAFRAVVTSVSMLLVSPMLFGFAYIRSPFSSIIQYPYELIPGFPLLAPSVLHFTHPSLGFFQLTT